MSEFTKATLTPDQAKKWGETRTALVWHCPAFSHVFYTMMSKHGGEHVATFIEPGDHGIPVAATDGQEILIVPEPFFKYNLRERIFILAHEICHGIFGHVELMFKLRKAGKVSYPDGKELSYDAGDMNRAMDYVINDMLIDSKIGSYNTNWLHDTTIATHMDSVLTAYRRIHQDKANGGAGGAAGSQFDKHLNPGQGQGQDPSQAAAGRSDIAWKTALAGGITAARALGKLPGALERALSDELAPTVDWTDMVQGFMSRKVGGGGYDWRKPDRRLVTRGIIAPGRSGFGCGTIVCGIDTSGSVGNDEISLFFGNMAGILEDLRPERIVVMFCDAHVHRVDELYDATDLYELRKSGAPGGGGTAFTPVFDKIAEMGLEPDALIYLTDGHGTFPARAPSFPVLWGSIGGNVSYPWGDIVPVPAQGG